MAHAQPKWKWAGSIAVISLVLAGCPSGGGDDGGVGGGSGGGSTGGGAGGATGGGAMGGGTGGTGGTGGGTAGGMGGGTAGGSAGGSTDLDVVVARFNPDGGLDTTFGSNGIARLDLGTATTPGNRDSVYGIDKDSSDRLIVFAASKGTGNRADNDRVTVRLSADGVRDNTFSGTGEFRLDSNGLSDNVRHGEVEPGGKIILGGYTPFPAIAADGGFTTQNSPVIARLDTNGALDPTFGDGGIALPSHPDFRPTDGGPAGMIEAYAVVRTSTGQYVTTGYARRRPSGTVDVVNLRLTESGQLDPSWNSNQGYFMFDVLGAFATDDRGRDLVMLPDGRPLVAGSTCPVSQGVLDAMVLMLTPGGQLDTTFNGGEGHKRYDFTKPDEAFFGVAVSPSGMQVAAAGYSGTVNMSDYDATLLLMPAAMGGPVEFSARIPLSPTANDRFWHVTFDTDNRPVAVGFVDVAGDTRMAVARFTPLGALDPTFGTAGVATLNVSPNGGTDETARAVVVQSTGMIVVVGVANH